MLTPLGRPDILRLAEIVREVTGNQVLEKNYPMIESRLRSHMIRLHIDSVDEYWSYFQKNETEERAALQSLMTTHYTFFFREYAHFETLENWIEENSHRLKERFQSTKQPLRVWCAASSRGQETYSLAMFLEAILVARHGIKYEVLGTDIDQQSVEYAKNGVYPIKEVNTIPQRYLSAYWKKGTGPVKEFAAAHPTLRSATRFQVMNLLELDKWNPNVKFDVVFCRNVFIYFSEENVKKISHDIVAKLEANALFVSGMSEPLRFDSWKYESVGPSCYRIGGTKAAPVKPAKATLAVVPAPSSTPIQNIPTAVVASAPAKTKYRVLCVDDSATIQLLIKKIFSQDPDCESVTTALNGREASEMLKKAKYDLITLDIHMPDVNGIEFLESFYNRKTDPPVLMVSSVNRTDIELATKSLSLGAFDYVEKPAMNNLQKSADEILTKTKMALRAKKTATTEEVLSFDNSISQKIVIPDASLCMRIVVASPTNLKLLEQVVKGQKQEYRSPPLLIVLNSDKDDSRVETEILQWTDRQVVSVRDKNQPLRPNHFYVAKKEVAEALFATSSARTVSIQFLDACALNIKGFKSASSFQVLFDENLSAKATDIARQLALPVSDISPATSFTSLSVEFFANLRKAVA